MGLTKIGTRLPLKEEEEEENNRADRGEITRAPPARAPFFLSVFTGP